MKNLLKVFLLTALLAFLPGLAAAQSAAGWEVNPAAYRYDMSLYLDFTFGPKEMDYEAYEVAAFVGDECRGIGKVLNLDGVDRPVIYLRAYSNVESGENLTLKYFDKSNGKTELIEGTSFPFVSGSRVGLPSEPQNVNIVRYFSVDLSVVGDGTLSVESGRYAEGTELTVNAVPAQGWHFVSWSDDSTDPAAVFTVDSDVTLAATFEVNVYKLVYKVDGEVTESFDVPYKEAVTPIAEPSKVGYTFSGWTGVPETMPYNDVEVTGVFTINQYHLVFKAGDTVVSEADVDYNSVITAPAAPDKVGHTFAGWEDFPANMPAEDLTVNGSYTVNSYKIFYKVDGEDYQEVTALYDSALTPIAEPTKTGYTFGGWQGLPATMPAEDVTVTGVFTINQYHLVFKAGDTVVSEADVDYNSVITAPAAPDKVGHTFAGWEDFPANMPAEDLTVNGSYTVNSYKIFYKVDGEDYQEVTALYDSALTPIAEPTKTGYTFGGWQGLPATMPAEDVTVTGVFTINQYHLVFKAGDTVVSEADVDYNSVITAPAAPDKVGHTFAGWEDFPANMPAEDLTVNGSYTVNSYRIFYKVDGEDYQEVTALYDSALTPIAEPTKTGYTFGGWQGLPATMPAEDVTVTGVFTINQYHLVFKAGDTIVSEADVDYNSVITAPAAPDKVGHTFAGWEDFPTNMPAEDLTVNGSYTVNKYTVTYMIEGETEAFATQEVDYGTAIELKTAPEREGYTFGGWQNVPETMPANDITLTGGYTVNSYHLIFKAGDTVVRDMVVEYGSVITAPGAPDKEGHTFDKWEDYPETMPASDLTVNAIYTVNKYTVTYMIEGETEAFATQEVEYGSAIELVSAPEREGYTFSGWEDVPETMPAYDITLTGGYTVNSYHLIFKAGDTVVSDTEVEYGSVITAPEAPEKEGHTFDKWEDYPETMPASDLTVNAIYTVNKYTVTYMIEGETEAFATQEVEYGSVIELMSAPEREGYTFSGWQDVPETMPANDIILSGSYTVNKYKLTIYLDDAVYSTEEVEYGSALDVKEPEVTAPNRRFLKWEEEIPATMPAHDLDLHAVTEYYDGVAMILDINEGTVDVYDVNGRAVRLGIDVKECDSLAPGIYIIAGRKIIIR